jgi:hypothetical protein
MAATVQITFHDIASHLLGIHLRFTCHSLAQRHRSIHPLSIHLTFTCHSPAITQNSLAITKTHANANPLQGAAGNCHRLRRRRLLTITAGRSVTMDVPSRPLPLSRL